MLGSCERAHSSNEYLYAESTLFKGVETGIEVEKPVFNIIQVYTLNYFCKAQTYHNAFQEENQQGHYQIPLAKRQASSCLGVCVRPFTTLGQILATLREGT